MISRSTGKLALSILIAFGTLTLAAPVQAGDFFSMLFGGLRPQPAPMVRMPFAPEEDQVAVPGDRPARIGYGGGQAFVSGRLGNECEGSMRETVVPVLVHG